jgi:glycosyltransferase involved in cell wall biosynthesis
MKALLLMPSRFFGGPETQTLQAARELKRRGVDFAFAVFPAGNRATGENPMVLEARKAGFEAFEFVQRFNYDLPSAFLKIRALVSSLRPDVVCSIGYKANLLTAFLSDRPTLAIVHGWTGSAPRLKLFEALDQRTLKRHTAVGYVSPSQLAKISALGVPDGRALRLTNALDAASLPPALDRAEFRRSLGLTPGAKLVGAVGRLSPEKGQRFLVEAFAALHRERPDSDRSLILVGDGPDETTLRALVAERGLGERTRFLGLRADGARIVGALDVLVLPSLTEAMPVVALEACAYRTPIVSSAVGAMPEILRDGAAGWLAAPGDPAALARGIAEALGDAGRKAEAARANLLARYTVEKQAEAWLEALRLCVKETRPS